MNRNIIMAIFLASGLLVICTPGNERTALNETGTANRVSASLITGEFPTASFAICKVRSGETGVLHITGNLTIKGVTRAININATEMKKREEYTARFTFDRFDWRIG